MTQHNTRLQDALDKMSKLMEEAKHIRAKAYAELDVVEKSKLYAQLEEKLIQVKQVVEGYT